MADLDGEFNDAIIPGSTDEICIDKISRLQAKGGDMHAYNESLLRTAAEFGYIGTAKYLLEHGANIHANKEGALLNAAQNGQAEMVEYFLGRKDKPDLHAQDDAALRAAAMNGHTDVVKILCKHGADIHADNDWAVKEAEKNGHTETAEFLRAEMARQASSNMDKKGASPLSPLASTGQDKGDQIGSVELLRDVPPQPVDDMPTTRPSASKIRGSKLLPFPRPTIGGDTKSHEVLPGEYDGLLEKFNALAKKMDIDKPPKLKIVEGASIAIYGGAHGTADGVSIDSNLLKILDANELEFTLAHELGHTKQYRSHQVFKSAEDYEKDADRQAVLVTRHPDAGISSLFKLGAAQMAELPKLIPGISEASLLKAKKSTDEMLQWRKENIRNTPLP